jgi:tetratricopeptide (TPR) repeat protein
MTKETSGEKVVRESRELIKSQKYSEACVHLQKLLQDDPSEEDALELLGMANFFQNHLEAARECFQQLTQLNPSHTKAWVNLGAILNRSGEYKKATEALRRAIQRDRKCVEAYYNMGIAHRGQQMNTMAISAYKEAIKIAPDMVDAHINLGNIYIDMKNVGLAIQCFNAALRYQPHSGKAKRCLERAQSQQKQSRKQTSPFGRLVDIKELDQQQQITPPRRLEQDCRKAERENAQKQTKLLRTNAKELINLLGLTLPQQLHRIKISILHVDEHIDASDLLQQFTTSLKHLKHLNEIQNNESRQLLETTAEATTQK